MPSQPTHDARQWEGNDRPEAARRSSWPHPLPHAASSSAAYSDTEPQIPRFPIVHTCVSGPLFAGASFGDCDPAATCFPASTSLDRHSTKSCEQARTYIIHTHQVPRVHVRARAALHSQVVCSTNRPQRTPRVLGTSQTVQPSTDLVGVGAESADTIHFDLSPHTVSCMEQPHVLSAQAALYLNVLTSNSLSILMYSEGCTPGCAVFMRSDSSVVSNASYAPLSCTRA